MIAEGVGEKGLREGEYLRSSLSTSYGCLPCAPRSPDPPLVRVLIFPSTPGRREGGIGPLYRSHHHDLFTFHLSPQKGRRTCGPVA
jgi:hypothetical protein